MVWEFFQMTNTQLINKEQLIEYFARGEKSPSQFLIGTEHERFLFNRRDVKRVPYEGPREIKTLLEYFRSLGWEPIYDQQNIVAVKNDELGASLTLEPGGQFELSGAPLADLHQTDAELSTYERLLHHLLDKLGLIDLTLGFDPLSLRDQVPWMPKQRYDIMKAYMPTKGNLGLDMMLRTCTVQVNLDYSSQEDMVKKFRVAMALQPLIATLFAASPFKDRYFSGLNSFRNFVWQDTDPDRCGFLKFVFAKDMGYERYVDYLLDIPMYFVYRHGVYTNAAGLSFRDYMAGNLKESLPHTPIMGDWVDQTTVAFPEVRLKQFIELRSADCGPRPLLMALPALWVGLLYDQQNLDDLHDMVMKWPLDSMQEVYLQAPHHGFQTSFLGKPITDFLNLLVAMARDGLERRTIWNQQGTKTESTYLRPLEVMLEDKINLSDYLQSYYRQRENFDFLMDKHFWINVDGWLQKS